MTTAATVVFTFVVSRWRPWNLFARGGFSTDFYDAQAHALLGGRLDVPPSVAGLEGFLIDGKTYLYFGPMLAIVRMPLAMFGSWADGRLSNASLVIAYFVACTAAFHLVRRVGDLLGGGSPRRYATFVAAVACSPALALAGWTSVYHETEMWAFALFLLTSVALLRLWKAPDRRSTVIAVVLACATVLTRSSIGLGALTAVALIGCLHWRSHRRVALSAVTGALGGVILNVGINFAKFGTLLDLPADRQVLTLQSPSRAAWFAGNDGSFFSVRFLPTTVLQYLRPDTIRFERLVPFVRFGPLARDHGSYPVEGNTPATSLTIAAAPLFALALLGVWVIVRRRSWVLGALWVGALVAALPSFVIGFIANRYLVDMLPALVIPASAAIVVVEVPAGAVGRWLRWAVVPVLLFGLWVNVAMATWVQNLKEPGFTAMRYRVDAAVFGGSPPSVIDIEPGAAVPRDGVVAIDADCDGLYIAEQGRWVPLELGDGVRRIEGSVPTEDGVVVIDTTDGDIDLHFAGGSVIVAYRPESGATIEGQQLPVADRRVTLEIRSDPVSGQLEITLDGRQALSAFAAPRLADAVVSEAFEIVAADDRGTPICSDLADRRRRADGD